MKDRSKPPSPGILRDADEDPTSGDRTEDSAFSDPLIQQFARTPSVRPDVLDTVLPCPREGEILKKTYRIERFIRSGGMGAVYKAYASDPPRLLI